MPDLQVRSDTGSPEKLWVGGCTSCIKIQPIYTVQNPKNGTNHFQHHLTVNDSRAAVTRKDSLGGRVLIVPHRHGQTQNMSAKRKPFVSCDYFLFAGVKSPVVKLKPGDLVHLFTSASLQLLQNTRPAYAGESIGLSQCYGAYICCVGMFCWQLSENAIKPEGKGSLWANTNGAVSTGSPASLLRYEKLDSGRQHACASTSSNMRSNQSS